MDIRGFDAHSIHVGYRRSFKRILGKLGELLRDFPEERTVAIVTSAESLLITHSSCSFVNGKVATELFLLDPRHVRARL